jgi:ABC-2 type transport system permease protein
VPPVDGAPALAAPPRAIATRSPASPFAALTRRAFLDARARTLAFVYIFGVYAWLQAAGFRSTYPTLADRVAFARSFAGNDAIRLFYGYPYNVITVGGYSAWRVGGTLAIAAAAFGLLAAVRALRAEEDAGRAEVVLSQPVGRGSVFGSAITAIAAGAALLWAAETAGFAVAGLPFGGSAYLALATVAVAPVFAGIGAVASQLAPTRRLALSLAAGAAVASWLLRAVADTWAGGAWLRWATPLGWAEELRPFTGPRPAVLVLPAVASAALLLVAARLSAVRDVGTGMLPARDIAEPRFALLSSPTAQSVRDQAGVLAAWAVGTGAFAAVLGMVSTSVSSAGISDQIRKDIARLGSGAITTPVGYLAFVFIVFVLAVCLFACGQIGAAREEEAQGRLETVLSRPVARSRWLCGRLAVAACGAAALSVLAGVVTWAGAASQGVHISLARMLEAGANCIPCALLFLGIGALAYAVAPRASSAITYGLVGAAFLWDLIGSFAGAPAWLADLTPFHHIGLVPVQSFRWLAAVAMVAVGAGTSLVALVVFGSRDLLGA